MLPVAARKALAVALAQKSLRGDRAWKALDRAFAAVGWVDPEDGIVPLAKDLSPVHRELIEALAARSDLELSRFYLSNVRVREWLGHAPPGVLEREIKYTFEKQPRREPLWRALRRFENHLDWKAKRAFVEKLPFATRLLGFVETIQDPLDHAYRLDPSTLFDGNDSKLLDRIRGEGKSWAPRVADALATVQNGVPDAVKWPVFLALVRAKIPIEPRWDRLLPITLGSHKRLSEECIRAIPEERRAGAIAAALPFLWLPEAGLWLLAKYPSATLAQEILDEGLDGDMPKHRVLAEMARIGKRHPVVLKTLQAFKKGKPPPLELRCTRRWKPKHARDLDATQQRQLEDAARRYCRSKQTAAQLLAKGGAFHNVVELGEIVGADGEPAFDAYFYVGDSGTIYRHGTTKAVASIIQGGLEMLVKDAALADGLDIALSH